ncbi:hypothetical protein [Lysinibacter sp. HNR]|uniref:hypothetical protein n=1 Tax=Lysinibacter sp. HNR TaxID=3031408 RepID=UPI0024360BCC|nr:hypothetical protein [Lysinibacter sp. HNR]WGD36651.1 hypothetical protein FrondiHNR_09285 [Lysinibacter sp. HNR]
MPADMRENMPTGGLAAVRYCWKFIIDRARLNDPVQAVKLALRALAVRAADLDTEIKELESALATLVHATVPTLVSKAGIGMIHTPNCWSLPTRILRSYAARRRSRGSARSHQCH